MIVKLHVSIVLPYLNFIHLQVWLLKRGKPLPKSPHVYLMYFIIYIALQLLSTKVIKYYLGLREESEVAGFFVFSDILMMGLFLVR